MKTELAFSKNSIINIIKKLPDDIFKNSANWFFESGQGDVPIFKNCTDEEKDFVKNYFDTIGKSDSLTQIKFIESCQNVLDEKVLDAETNEKKYKSLYVKLGFFFGLLIFIIVL